MAAPTVVEHTASSSFVTATSPKTGASTLALAEGDLIIAGVAEENDDGDEDFNWSDSVGLNTWTEHATSNGSTDADTFIGTAECTVTDPGATVTVTATKAAGASGFWGGGWVQFQTGTHGGVGAIARTAGAGGAPSLSITTTAANSAIVVFAADWNAGDGGSRARKSVNGSTGVEVAYAFDSVHYTAYAWYHADAGAAGAKTVGLDTPSGGDFQIIAIEVLGAGDPPDPPVPTQVTYVSQGAAVAGTTSITTAAYGTGWAEGDLGVCVVASNHTTEATEPTVSGFTKIGTLNGGGGTQGAGTGNRRLTFFTRELLSGDDTTPTISLATGNVMVAAITILRKESGSTWDAPVAAFGAETTAGTGWSQAMTSDPGFDNLGMAVLACAVRDTSASTAEGITATGATFGTVTERADLASETGNDINLHVSTCDITAGPSSANATLTATHATSETGVMGVLRVSAAEPAPTGDPASGTAAIEVSGAAALAAAASATAAVSVSGAAGPLTGASGAAAAAVAVSGTAAARGAATATASVAVSGTANARGVATASASVAVSGTGAARGATTGSAAVDVSGGGAASGALTASASISVAGTAVAETTLPATATAAISVSGSAVAAAPATATASVSVSGAGAAGVPATATASIAVSGAASARGVAAATAAVAVSGTGAARAATTAAAAISVSGAGAARAALSGTASIAVSGVGTARAATTATASVNVSGVATLGARAVAAAAVEVTGLAFLGGGSGAAGTAAISVAGTAAARGGSPGTASISVSGTANARAVAVASASISVSGVGAARAPLTATAAVSVNGLVVAGIPVTATASVSVSGTAALAARATAAAAVSVSGTGVGRGAATASAFVEAMGTGTVLPLVTASAEVEVSGTAAAVAALTATAEIDVSGYALLVTLPNYEDGHGTIRRQRTRATVRPDTTRGTIRRNRSRAVIRETETALVGVVVAKARIR
jgi:hypothetical protein